MANRDKVQVDKKQVNGSSRKCTRDTMARDSLFSTAIVFEKMFVQCNNLCGK